MKLSLLFLLIFNFIFGQIKPNNFDTYLKNLDSARVLSQKGDYKSSIKKFNKAINFAIKHPTLNNFGYFYMEKSSCYFRQNKFRKGLKEFKKGIVYGMKIDVLGYEHLFNDTLAKKINKKIAKEYNELINKQYSKIKSPEINIEIEKLVAQDQFFRTNGDLFKSKGIIKTDDDFWKTIEIIDSINIVKCIDIVKKKGWVNEMWPLLWHHRDTYKTNNYVWSFFIPFINLEIQKGNVATSFFSWFEDYKNLQENGLSLYGVLPGKVDEKKVNIKRLEIFLTPLNNEQIYFKNNN